MVVHSHTLHGPSRALSPDLSLCLFWAPQLSGFAPSRRAVPCVSLSGLANAGLCCVLCVLCTVVVSVVHLAMYGMVFSNKTRLVVRPMALCAFLLIVLFSVQMDLYYTSAQLRHLKCFSRLDSATYGLCKTIGIARLPRYIHRSSKR